VDLKQKKTLEKIVKQLDSLLVELHELLSSDQNDDTKVAPEKTVSYSCIDETLKQELIAKGRQGTEEYLKELNSKTLGEIIRKIGGSSEETKRSKEDMVKNILYKLFDFNIGHSIIKGEIN
jgi:hypothetical protein